MVSLAIDCLESFILITWRNDFVIHCRHRLLYMTPWFLLSRTLKLYVQWNMVWSSHLITTDHDSCITIRNCLLLTASLWWSPVTIEHRIHTLKQVALSAALCHAGPDPVVGCSKLHSTLTYANAGPDTYIHFVVLVFSFYQDFKWSTSKCSTSTHGDITCCNFWSWCFSSSHLCISLALKQLAQCGGGGGIWIMI